MPIPKKANCHGLLVEVDIDTDSEVLNDKEGDVEVDVEVEVLNDCDNDELIDADAEALIDGERLVEFDKEELIELDKELDVKLPEAETIDDDIEANVLPEVLKDADVIEKLLFEIDELLGIDEIADGCIILDSNKEPIEPITEPILTIFGLCVLLSNEFNVLYMSSIFISFGSVQSFCNIPFSFDISSILL